MNQRIPPIEHRRIQNINFVMDDLHSSLNSIYEHLIDREYEPLRKEVNVFSKKLKSVSDSVTNEV